jgi:predicted HicB family RNase H-like nuclease
MKKMKAYKGYTATVEFDADEMVLHGRVDHIRDVVTFHATSVEGIEPAFAEAVDDYLALCDERGEEPDRPFSGRFVLRLEPQIHRDIAVRAALEGKSLNAWIVDALQSALGVAEDSESRTPLRRLA